MTALLVREHRERLAAMASSPGRVSKQRAVRASALRRVLVVVRFRLAGIPTPAVGSGC